MQNHLAIKCVGQRRIPQQANIQYALVERRDVTRIHFTRLHMHSPG